MGPREEASTLSLNASCEGYLPGKGRPPWPWVWESQEGAGSFHLPETPEGLSCGEAEAMLRDFQLETSEICKKWPQGMFREEAAQTANGGVDVAAWVIRIERK